MAASVRSALARLVLLATAVALLLLGRPTEELCAQSHEGEQASQGSADDVSLRSGRRHTPVLRLAYAGADEEEDELQSAPLPNGWRIDVLAASMRDPTLGSEVRSSPVVAHRWSVSARGPPAIRS